MSALELVAVVPAVVGLIVLAAGSLLGVAR